MQRKHIHIAIPIRFPKKNPSQLRYVYMYAALWY